MRGHIARASSASDQELDGTNPADSSPLAYSASRTGFTGLLQTLQEHYANLSHGYMSKGMTEEARLFRDVVARFARNEQDIRELLAARRNVARDSE